MKIVEPCFLYLSRIQKVEYHPTCRFGLSLVLLVTSLTPVERDHAFGMDMRKRGRRPLWLVETANDHLSFKTSCAACGPP